MNTDADNFLSVLQRPMPFAGGGRRMWRSAVVLLVVVTVYLAAVSPHWYIGDDSALYLSLGRNLARGQGYTIAGRPHRQVPPGFPLLTAAVMKLGARGFLGLNLAMCLIGLATWALSYLLFRELVHADWAVLLTAALGLSREMLRRSGELLSDMPFTLVLVAALWLYARGLRKRDPRRGGWEIASLLLAGSCWIRLPGLPIAIVAPIGLVLSARARGLRRALLNMGIVYLLLVVSALGAIRLHAANTDPHAPSYVEALASWTEGYTLWDWIVNFLRHFWGASGAYCRLLIAQRMPLLLCMLLLVLPTCIGMARRIRQRDWLAPLVVAGYVGALSLVGLETRYLLPIFTLLLVLLLEGWAWMLAKVSAKRPARTVGLVAAIVGVVVALNVPLLVRNIVRKHAEDYQHLQQRGKWKDLYAAGEFLRTAAAPGDVVLGSQVVGFLADLPAPPLSSRTLSSSPTEEELLRLLRDWQVRFPVVDLRKEPLPFTHALQRYLDAGGKPIFSQGAVCIYALDAGRGPRQGDELLKDLSE